MSTEAQAQPAAASENDAVARCRAAWKQAYDAARALGRDSYDATKFAREAYRTAMPALSSPDNIRDFVACIAHGILLEIIPQDQSTRLLYAAQVAITAHRKPPSPRKASAAD
jgi:hypothetical protein